MKRSFTISWHHDVVYDNLESARLTIENQNKEIIELKKKLNNVEEFIERSRKFMKYNHDKIYGETKKIKECLEHIHHYIS